MNFAQTFKALSNPIRRSILELLKAGKLSAGDIAGHFDVAGATISHHLNLLKQADLIREEKEKNFINYCGGCFVYDIYIRGGFCRRHERKHRL